METGLTSNTNATNWDLVLNEYSAEERRQQRIEMCGKPYYRAQAATGHMEKFFPRCKEWRHCDFCFRHKVDEELGRIAALGELGRVMVSASAWHTVYRYMERHGIAYRRYAQEGNGLIVLLLPDDARAVAEHFDLAIHRFTAAPRTIAYIMNHLPLHKSITGKLGALAGAACEPNVVYASTAIRVDGEHVEVLEKIWDETRESLGAEIYSVQSAISKLAKTQDYLGTGNLKVCLEILDSKVSKGVIAELDRRDIACKVLNHTRLISVSNLEMVCEKGLQSQEELCRRDSDKGCEVPRMGVGVLTRGRLDKLANLAI